MKKLALAVALVATISAVYFAAQPKPPPAEVRVAYQKLTQAWPHYVAEARGLYRDAGLDVKASDLETSNQVAQELVAGHFDVGLNFSSVPMLSLISAGAAAPLVFNSNLTTPQAWIDAVIVMPDSPVQSLGDLSGKRIGVFPGTTAKAILLAVFRAQYPDRPPPVPVDLLPPLQIGELSGKRVDAVHAYEPTLALATTNLKCRIVGGSIFAQFCDPNPMGIGAFNRDWAGRRKDTAKAFASAYAKACAYIESNRKEAEEIFVQRTKLDAAAVAHLRYVTPTMYHRLSTEDFQRFADKLRALNELKGQGPVDASKLLFKP